VKAQFTKKNKYNSLFATLPDFLRPHEYKKPVDALSKLRALLKVNDFHLLESKLLEQIKQ
jgi:hypothetical protein